MSPKPSPLLGYNNNVRHKGRVFHIQTEDSGVRYGHIITHLFIDGGRILKSVKTSYAEHLSNERRAEIVREMMKQQHKAMFIALRDGKFDGMLQPPAGGSTEARGAEAEEAGEERSPSTPPPAIEAEVVERMAAAPASVRGGPVVPPPPPALGRDRSPARAPRTGAPPATSTRAPGGSLPADAPPDVAPEPSRRSPAAPARAEHRYAATRPASVFGQARPQQGKSVFGEDLHSDKSLDDAILSYLSNDPEDDNT